MERVVCRMGGSGKPLEGVNVNTTPDVIQDKYDKWAEKYDTDMSNCSYGAPSSALKAFLENAEEHGIKKDSRIIDVGAGTGIVGALLQKEGYTNIAAVDISPDMLQIARGKNCYNKFICGGLGNNSLSIPDNEYDGLLCIGCITPGHINPMGIKEMLDMIRPGGLYLITVRWDVDTDEYGYAGKMEELVTQGKMKKLFKIKSDNLGATDAQDLARYCYLYGFTKN